PWTYTNRSPPFRSKCHCALPTALPEPPTVPRTTLARSPDPSATLPRRCFHLCKGPFPSFPLHSSNGRLPVPHSAHRDALAPPHTPAPHLSGPPQWQQSARHRASPDASRSFQRPLICTFHHPPPDPAAAVPPRSPHK